MRSIFEEDDVICVSPVIHIIYLFRKGWIYDQSFVTNNASFQAEVRGLQHDGLHLQARSQKYGKVCLILFIIFKILYSDVDSKKEETIYWLALFS